MLFKKLLPVGLKNALDSYIRKTYEPPVEDAVCEEAVPICEAPALHPTEKQEKLCIPAPEYREPTYGAVPASAPKPAAKKRSADSAPRPYREPQNAGQTIAVSSVISLGLEKELSMLDESFQEMLLRKIDEKGMRDSTCYKRAGVDRKLFSKIRSNPFYKPKKSTAIAFCVALELPFSEATELLRKAGYALSHSSKFDVIVEYFLRSGRYNLHELNIALYEYDQPVI